MSQLQATPDFDDKVSKLEGFASQPTINYEAATSYTWFHRQSFIPDSLDWIETDYYISEMYRNLKKRNVSLDKIQKEYPHPVVWPSTEQLGNLHALLALEYLR